MLSLRGIGDRITMIIHLDITNWDVYTFRVHKPSTMPMKSVCICIVAVTMWLGGFGCAFCCVTSLVDSCCLNERDMSVGCSEKACCKQATKKNSSESREAISKSDGAIGCSLLPNQSRNLAPLPRVSDDSSHGVQALDSPLAFLTNSLVGPRPDSPSPLNRGGTYLRLCVLLI